MARGPRNPETLFSELTVDYQQAFERDLESVILYGSAAGKDYNPERSDINLMIVLSEEGIDQLERALPLMRKWRRKGVAVPLVVTRSYVSSSVDVFPIEYLSFQRQHRVLYGPDVLEELSFDPEHLRLQCEREIKGKLILLREGFLDARGAPKALEGLIARSLPAFIAIFQALLHLQGEAIPETKEEVAVRACEALGLDAPTFKMLVALRAGRVKLKEPEIQALFKDYLHEVRQLAMKVDRMGGEDA